MNSPKHKANLKVLVLGSRGLLGSAILEVAAKWEDVEIIGLDRTELDITKKDKLNRVIKEISPNILINAIALTDVDKCEEMPEKAFEINGQCAGDIAAACEENSCKMIQISTDYVFDGKEKNGYTEQALPNPISVYGQSKLSGEQLVAKNCQKHFIVRISWLFGNTNPQQSPRKDFIQNILNWSKSSQQLKILNDQIGKATYTRDTAKALKDFFYSDEYGIYHLCNEGETTRYEMAKETFALLSRPEITIQPAKASELNVEWKAQRPQYSILKNTKLPQLRHWKLALKHYLEHL